MKHYIYLSSQENPSQPSAVGFVKGCDKTIPQMNYFFLQGEEFRPTKPIVIPFTDLAETRELPVFADAYKATNIMPADRFLDAQKTVEQEALFVPDVSSYQTAPLHRQPAQTERDAKQVFVPVRAGFIQRSIAYLLDIVTMYGLGYLLSLCCARTMPFLLSAHDILTMLPTLMLASTLVLFLPSVFCFLWEGFYGVSLGKKLMGLSIRDESGAFAHSYALWMRALQKYSCPLFYFLGVMIGLIGLTLNLRLFSFPLRIAFFFLSCVVYLVFLVSCLKSLFGTKQTWHDAHSHTAVFKLK